MNYLVIDLEMCMVPRMYRNKFFRRKQEIIQIGAVLLDEDYNEIAELSQFVHPEHGVIDHFITNLTGITAADVKYAPNLAEAIKTLIVWLDGRDCKFIAWSDSDYAQLQYEIKAKGLLGDMYEWILYKENWIDYQHVFDTRYQRLTHTALENALMMADIVAEGRLHDGLADAINTANLIRKLERNPEYQIQTFESYVHEEEDCNTSIASLLKGIILKPCV